MKLRIDRATLFMVLGGMVNVTVQLSMFFNNWETLHQRETTLGEFLHEFSWLMLAVTMLFFWLLGTLYQRAVDEREEAAEIAAELAARHKR